MSEVEMQTELELERRRQALLLEIEAAFGDVRKGDGIGVREANQWDATFTDSPEASAALTVARAADVEDRWQDIPEQLLKDYEAPLMWTDALGFQFMLPAYMRRVLLSCYPDAIGIRSEYVIVWLLTDLSNAIYQLDSPLLTPQQISYIERFFNWIKDCDVAKIDDLALQRLNYFFENKNCNI